MLLKMAIVLLLLGSILFVYAGLVYRQISHDLQEAKKGDLVAYYLDLFYRLLPGPFWCAAAGIILMLLALITGTVAICLDFGP